MIGFSNCNLHATMHLCMSKIIWDFVFTYCLILGGWSGGSIIHKRHAFLPLMKGLSRWGGGIRPASPFLLV